MLPSNIAEVVEAIIIKSLAQRTLGLIDIMSSVGVII